MNVFQQKLERAFSFSLWLYLVGNTLGGGVRMELVAEELLSVGAV